MLIETFIKLFINMRCYILKFFRNVNFGAVIAATFFFASSAGSETEKIAGHVLGTAVKYSEIRNLDGSISLKKASDAFVSPLIGDFVKRNESKIIPTEEEIEKASRYFASCKDAKTGKPLLDQSSQRSDMKELVEQIDLKLKEPGLADKERSELTQQRDEFQKYIDSPGRFMAVFTLSSWKAQKLLYDQYGGGRILFQQAGNEAFDATLKFLESEEKSKRLEFASPEVRKAALEYWHRDHGAFLSNNKDVIEEFVSPEWMSGKPCEIK